MPLSVKVPFLVSSSYRKAVQARDQILDIIAKRLENQDSTFLKEAREKSRQTGAINDDFFKVGLVLHIFLILYPPLEKSTTRTTIIARQGGSNLKIKLAKCKELNQL